jgi:hypothetical protein
MPHEPAPHFHRIGSHVTVHAMARSVAHIIIDDIAGIGAH